MSYDEKNQTSLAAISKIVKSYLTFYRNDYINDCINDCKNKEDVSDEMMELVEKEADLLINAMIEEVWNLNKDRIIEKLENQNTQILNKEMEKLKERHEKNEKIDGLKNIIGLLGDGIVIAFLIGIGVNQCTEIILKIKEAILIATKIPAWVTTCITIVLITFIILFILLKRFMDRFGEVVKIIFSGKTSD